MATSLEQFSKQEYINLESFRKNGQGVKTPVWFLEKNSRVYVRTLAQSGKVKRIRRNAQVHFVPCEADGKVTGEWVPGSAAVITDQEQAKEINQLMRGKYGIRKSFYDLAAAITRKNFVTIEIQPETAG